MKEFTHLDPDLMLSLELWIDSLQQSGVQVVFWLSPYHPDAYRFLANSSDYRIILDVQKYFEELAISKNIPLVGSYNPEDIPCTKDEFYDEQHPKESCLEKIWAEYK